MKTKITLIFLLFSIANFAQTNSKATTKKTHLINESDFKIVGDKIEFRKIIKLKNGNNLDTDVDAFIPLKKSQLDSIGIGKINEMVQWGFVKAKYAVKNKSTYIPKKLGLFFMENKNTYTVKIDFTAQNDMGGTKDGTKYYVFDSKGEFISEM